MLASDRNLVRGVAESLVVCGSDDVVAFVAESFGGVSRVVNVQQQPHRASASRIRFHAASASAAAARLASSSRSTSSEYSA